MPQQSQFKWNDEKILIFNLLVAGTSKKDIKAQGVHHETIRRVEQQLPKGNYPPDVDVALLEPKKPPPLDKTKRLLSRSSIIGQ